MNTIRRRRDYLPGVKLLTILSVFAPGGSNTLAQADVAAVDKEKRTEDVQDLMDILETPVEVYTATKAAETLQEAPAIITVITRDDIRAWGHNSLAEVLSHILGFYVIDDHILPDVAVRGIS